MKNKIIGILMFSIVLIVTLLSTVVLADDPITINEYGEADPNGNIQIYLDNNNEWRFVEGKLPEKNTYENSEMIYYTFSDLLWGGKNTLAETLQHLAYKDANGNYVPITMPTNGDIETVYSAGEGQYSEYNEAKYRTKEDFEAAGLPYVEYNNAWGQLYGEYIDYCIANNVTPEIFVLTSVATVETYNKYVTNEVYLKVDDAREYANDLNTTNFIKVERAPDKYQTDAQKLNQNKDITDTVEKENSDTEEDHAGLLQTLITWFLMILGELVHWLLSLFAGSSGISIETIIFDRYPYTKLSLFYTPGAYERTNPNPLLGNSGGGGIIDNFNTFYNFFKNIAVLVYVAILAYMAIKIMFSDNAGKKAKVKDFILYWVQGVAILFLFPYVMKYTIMINSAIVKYTATANDQYIGEKLNQPTINQTPIKSMSAIPDFTKASSSGNDYMSVMEKKAFTTGHMIYAICYMVMLYQIVTFIFIYYKRLLVTIFLIAIFPLVTITYALDKTGDGKSQAFDNWFKEFYLNVFMQTFHAINYVIVMGIITSLNAADNWLLIVCGITYITKGEEILRGLFGQTKGGGADTVKGAAKTAAQTFAYTKIAKDSVRKVKKTFGRGGTISQQRSVAFDKKMASLNLKQSKFEKEIYQDRKDNSELVGREISDSINTALDNTSTNEQRMAALDTLRRDSINANTKDVFDKKIGELSPAEQQTLSDMVGAQTAADAIEAGVMNINLNQQINIAIKYIKKRRQACRAITK